MILSLTYMSVTEQILSLLIAERDRLSRAIEALQGPTKRRGRPPKSPLSMPAPPAAVPTKRAKRGNRTAAQKKAQSERMKKYWAERRKAG
jgi:hypothetical protein